MLYPSVSRVWNGIHIEGQQICLQVNPQAEGTLTVDVVALPVLTGFDRPCRISGEERLEFAGANVVVHDTRLECFAADRFVPFMRRGFAIDIEPGMAQALRAWLPKIILVASTSKTIADRFIQLHQPPIHHMLDAITSVAARIALGTLHAPATGSRLNLTSWSVDESLRFEREYGVWRSCPEFMSLFDDNNVRQALVALAQSEASQPLTDMHKEPQPAAPQQGVPA